MASTFFARQIRNFARLLLGPALEVAVTLRYRLAPYALPTASVNDSRLGDSTHEIVDAVYTWVDGRDPVWLEKKKFYQKIENPTEIHPSSTHHSRFHNRDELKYSLRSLSLYAKYVRNIYIVTDNQIPSWLNLQHPQIHVVDHKEIFPDREALPTFNAHAIETCLHHIPGLNERYLYLNDDFFFGHKSRYSDFFAPDGRAIAYLSPDVVKKEPADESDSSEVWATHNDRVLIYELFGKPLTNKILHVPYSQLKSILYELESRASHEFTKTAKNRFRSKTDIKVPCSLFPYYGYYIDKVKFVPHNNAAVFNRYVNVASPFFRPVSRELLLTSKYATFCINEPISSDSDTSRFDALIFRFLDSYFPEKSPFEI
jgi:hypothetical protein